MSVKLRVGDIAVFKNGEEAVVKMITRSGQDYFRILFNKRISGWIGHEAKDYCWSYNGRGVFKTDFPNGNDIVKVIPC